MNTRSCKMVTATQMPNGPSAGTVAVHHVIHARYRSWCRARVSGRSLSAKHIASDHVTRWLWSGLTMAGWSMEMACRCCSGKIRNTDGSTTLQIKGAVHLWPLKTFEDRLSLASDLRLVTRSDCEPSILVWETQVAAGVARLYGRPS